MKTNTNTNTNKRALTAYDEMDMSCKHRIANYDVAKRAADEGRDLIVHICRYDGQRYHSYTNRVTDLHVASDGNVYGHCYDNWSGQPNQLWRATRDTGWDAWTGWGE